MITFHSPTILPIEAATTMGVSVKESDNAIGKFGTGLKYAITVPLGRTVDRRQAWRERAEAAAQAALHAAYTGQSAHTVAGRRAEYQPMRNGIDKGLTTDHNDCTNGDSDHA